MIVILKSTATDDDPPQRCRHGQSAKVAHLRGSERRQGDSFGVAESDEGSRIPQRADDARAAERRTRVDAEAADMKGGKHAAPDVARGRIEMAIHGRGRRE